MFPSKYLLPRKIAQGGSAEIYRAVQSNSMGFKRAVAIKRILPEHVGSQVHETMLVNEAKLLVTLNHPNIVKVYDLGCSEGAFYFVMEFVEGCDLRAVMHHFAKRGKRLPLENTVLIAIELCKALDYAHRKTDSFGLPLHLVHLDVSPKNVLLSDHGEVKLTDFGIASFKKNLELERTAGKMVRGKFSYMSPEQALGHDVDARSDIYSLGLMIYEMLCGKRYFQSDGLEALQKEHAERPPQAPLLPPNIPAELEFIVLKCLAEDPAQRFASARDVQMELLRFLFEILGTIPHQQLGFMMEEVLEELRREQPPKKRRFDPHLERTVTGEHYLRKPAATALRPAPKA